MGYSPENRPRLLILSLEDEKSCFLIEKIVQCAAVKSRTLPKKISGRSPEPLHERKPRITFSVKAR